MSLNGLRIGGGYKPPMTKRDKIIVRIVGYSAFLGVILGLAWWLT